MRDNETAEQPKGMTREELLALPAAVDLDTGKSGGSISKETLQENPGSVAVVRGRSTSRSQPRALKELRTVPGGSEPTSGASRVSIATRKSASAS